MEIRKHFLRSFVILTVKESNSEDNNEILNTPVDINALVNECISLGYRKIALQFSPECHSNGWSSGFVIIMADCIGKRGGEVSVIEEEPSLRDKWSHLISSFGIRIFSTIGELNEKDHYPCEHGIKSRMERNVVR